MKISRLLSLALLPLLANFALAQEAPGNGTGAFDTANNGAVGGANLAPPRVSQVDAAALAGLPALLGRGGGGAISLRASQEEFDADPAAKQALLAFVRGGGTVFLHTGAARAFGFRTVAARPGSNTRAGQLYGRARAALPFGAHPLLWDDAKSDGKGVVSRAPGADPTLFPGVNVVFYQMQEGDHLVQSHPAGTPLLEALDLSGNSQNTLFAAALAPFGRGFAIFTPDFVDQNRGDGALFARNLLRVIAPGAGNPVAGSSIGTGLNSRLVAVAARAIENGGTSPEALIQALVSANAGAASPALPAFGTPPNAPRPARATRNNPPMTPPMDAPDAQNAPDEEAQNNGAQNENDADNNAAAGGVANEGEGDGEEVAGGEEVAEGDIGDAVVLLSSAEAQAYTNLLAAGDARASATINLLRARLFLGRGDTRSAARSLDASAALAPNSAEIALWRGVLQAGAAQNINQPSPTRAQLVQGAARDLDRAVGSPSLFAGVNGGGAGVAMLPRNPRGAAGTGGTGTGGGNAAGAPSLGGIPLSSLRSWSAKLARIAQIFDLEPPLVERYGTGNGAIIVRAVAEDSSLRLIVPGAQALANARNFGWHGDNEEILLFPTPETYLNYRRALGLTAATVPLPAGAVGDVVGQRISMLALPSTPAVRRNPTTGQVTVLANRNSAANVLARLHSYVLLGAYDESAQSPVWLQLGLENLINYAVVGATEVISNTQTLEQTAQAGGLLTPEQFNNGLVQGRPDQLTIAQAQAASLVEYFYRVFGAGAVTETIQRLGIGQSVDNALEATTEGDELTLFRNWRQAQFGPRNFPNQG